MQWQRECLSVAQANHMLTAKRSRGVTDRVLPAATWSFVSARQTMCCGQKSVCAVCAVYHK